jgi:AraC family transcriptional activator FtrA
MAGSSAERASLRLKGAKASPDGSGESAIERMQVQYRGESSDGRPPVVALLAYDGLSLFEYGCVVEIFGRLHGQFGDGWYQLEIAAAESGELQAPGELCIKARRGLEALEDAHTVIVPGWRHIDAPIPAALCDALRRVHARGGRVISICTGAFVLAAAGLLDGLPATTHWLHAKELSERYPAVRVDPNVLYVQAGSVATSAGSAAGLDLCLHIVREDYGAEVANLVARRLVLPAHREGYQRQMIAGPVAPQAGARLAAIMDEVRATLDAPWKVKDMASSAGMSLRSFHRHFEASNGLSPHQWLVLERVQLARRLLDQSDRNVEWIAHRVGSASAAALRSQFHRWFGCTPADFRRGTRTGP